MTELKHESQTRSARLARWLGYAGLIPFVAGTVLLIGGHIGVRELALEGLIVYAAIILGFMGAVHWGRAMFVLNDQDARMAFIVSVLPALIGWLATLLAARVALAGLAVAFTVLYLYDRATMGKSARSSSLNTGINNDWYLPLRLRLTSVVVICLILCLVLL